MSNWFCVTRKLIANGLISIIPLALLHSNSPLTSVSPPFPLFFSFSHLNPSLFGVLDLDWSVFLRGTASLELFFTFFSFKVRSTSKKAALYSRALQYQVLTGRLNEHLNVRFCFLTIY